MVTIKILGIPDSQRTLELTSRVQAALEHLKIETTLNIESDLQKLISYNLSGIPALAINNQVIFQKDLPNIEDIISKIAEQLEIDQK